MVLSTRETNLFSDDKKRAKVGKVTIDITGNRYRLRFTHPKGQRQQFKIIGEISDDTWALALKTASLVNRDIALDDVDFTYGRYSAYRASSLKIAEREPNIKEIWDRYKELKKSSIALTTQNNLWKDCDRYLSRVDDKLLDLSKAQEFLAHLQTKYAVSTIATLFRSCLNPAINLAVEAELITKNPFDKIQIPKPQKKAPECFEPQEIREIIKAFYNDNYSPKTSGYAHSHYAHYVELLALTGARPEEIVALTREDIKRKGGNTYIRFSKAYSKGILLPHTKSKEIRLFKCNKQLTRLIDSIKKTDNNRPLA